jgi:biotin carboxylase
MKPVYRAAGIPTARNHRVTDIEAAWAFIEEAGGFPVFAKPDVGVGASDTFKICSEEDLYEFFRVKPDEQYVMEEFVVGEVYSYDAISDSEGNVMFESCFKCPNVADSVNNGTEVLYYVLPDIPEQLRDYGRRAIAAFGVRSRFTHFEFFRLTEGRRGLGEPGDFVGLEVNMRPAGGYTPDMINFAHSCDVYQMWADMVSFDEIRHHPDGNDRFCMFTGRKDSYQHTHSDQEIKDRYGDRIMMDGRMPDIFAAAMGNHMYVVLCDSMEEVHEIGEFILDDVSYLL